MRHVAGTEHGSVGDIAFRMRDSVFMVTEDMRGAAPETQPVKSAERTIHILETLAASPTRMSLGELQEACKYPRSSLHALLRTLKDLRWIEADESGSRYGIGTHALLAGTSYLDKDSVVSRAAAVLEALRSEVSHTVHFARRDEASVIYLASRGSKVEVRRMHRVGRKLPCHVTALGQALLAELTTSEVREMLPAKLDDSPRTPSSTSTTSSPNWARCATAGGPWNENRERSAWCVSQPSCPTESPPPTPSACPCPPRSRRTRVSWSGSPACSRSTRPPGPGN